VNRLLGIDHGRRRIGLAIAETETGLAFARPALRRHGRGRDLAFIAELAHAEGITTVVVGLPLNMDGSEGAQASEVRRFGALLVEQGLDVVFSDERLTSWAAGEELAAAGRRASRASGELDSAAARLLLQQYLDAHRASPDAPADVSEESR
jgi:putative Holliday junction resolvase